MGDLSKYIKKENERLEGALKRMQEESECSKARSKRKARAQRRSKGKARAQRRARREKQVLKGT